VVVRDAATAAQSAHPDWISATIHASSTAFPRGGTALSFFTGFRNKMPEFCFGVTQSMLPANPG
jgi:hypothetical protein